MSISPSDHNLAMMHLDQNNAVQKKMDMDGLRKRLDAAPDKAAKLREACEGFESIFIQKMWEQMRKNVQKEGYLHSRDEQMYQGMYDMEFSKKLTQAGGIGLANMLYEQLSQRLGESSRTSSTRNDPRLPIIPSGSSVTGLGAEPRPLGQELENGRLGNIRPEAGIPLNNRQIKPLYEDVPAFMTPAVTQGASDTTEDLAPFDDEVMEEQADSMEWREHGQTDEIDFEAISQSLLEEELNARPQAFENTATQEAAEQDSPEASVTQQTSVLSPKEMVILEAALRQSMAKASRITEAQAPAAAPRGPDYTQIEQATKDTLQQNGTNFARKMAKSAETAGTTPKNNVPRS